MSDTHLHKLAHHRWLNPATFVLAIAVLLFLCVAIYVARELKTDPEGVTLQYLFEPFFLVVAAFLVWYRKTWTLVAGLLIAGFMLYQRGYGGYRGMAESAGAPKISRRALNLFFGWLFSPWSDSVDHLLYALELGLAVIVSSCALVMLAIELYRRKRVTAHGI